MNVTCEFCRKDYAVRCTYCGVVSRAVHHDAPYVGGRGYISVDFCHDGQACAAQRAGRAAPAQKETVRA